MGTDQERERFLRNVIISNDHWVWLGRSRGRFNVHLFRNKERLADKVAWYLFKGVVEKGWYIDCLCDRQCLNPRHGRLGLGREETQYGLSRRVVEEIRQRFITTHHSVLAKEYGVDIDVMMQVLTHPDWKDETYEEYDQRTWPPLEDTVERYILEMPADWTDVRD